jgi:glutamyl/glutaminyl-tRNA synthetase
MSLPELIRALNFDTINSTGQIRYDVEKLTWLNHKWIDRLESATLTAYCLPFLEKSYPAVKSMDTVTLTKLIQLIKTDLSTLTEVTNALHFYFNVPALTKHDIATHMTPDVVEHIASLVLEHRPLLHTDADKFLTTLKTAAKEKKIALKDLYTFLRLMLMEETEGPAIADLITMLGIQEVDARINKVLR